MPKETIRKHLSIHWETSIYNKIQSNGLQQLFQALPDGVVVEAAGEGEAGKFGAELVGVGLGEGAELLAEEVEAGVGVGRAGDGGEGGFDGGGGDALAAEHEGDFLPAPAVEAEFVLGVDAGETVVVHEAVAEEVVQDAGNVLLGQFPSEELLPDVGGAAFLFAALSGDEVQGFLRRHRFPPAIRCLPR